MNLAHEKDIMLDELTDKDIQNLERIRKKLRKHEAQLKATINELAERGVQVTVRCGTQTVLIDQIRFSFLRLK